MKTTSAISCALGILLFFSLLARAQPNAGDAPLSVAILSFEEKGESKDALGEKASLLLGAFLAADDNLMMVERDELETSLEELELTLTGTVNPSTAARIGQVTGAKVIITGRVFPVGEQTYAVAKVISVETSRVFAANAKFGGEDELDEAITGLSETISGILAKNRSELVARVEEPEERIQRLQAMLGDKGNGKKVFVSIPEQHISRVIPDPAVETEMLLTFQKLGFDITDDRDAADIRITGEAFSENSGRRGQLFSCRSRAEIRQHDKSGELISVYRQTEVAIDLAENIAAKKALQKAGSVLAERVIQRISKEEG